MRLDRLITLNLVQPLRRFRTFDIGQSTADTTLPILMYHSICGDPEPAVPAYYKTHTSPAVFRQQMALLSARGYKGISLEAGLELLRTNEARNTRHVVLTFDDGFRNFYTEAFPVLQKSGFTATVFVPTAFIGTARRSFHGTECLTWGEVRELRDGGIQFGSHTVTHPRLTKLSRKEIEHELRDSKKELQQRLGQPITTFAYPFAFPRSNRKFVQTFEGLLAAEGYGCCATTEVGRVQPGDDVYRLRRLPANTLDDAALFGAKLDGAYDWLRLPQRIIKESRRWASFGSRRNGWLGPARFPSPL